MMEQIFKNIWKKLSFINIYSYLNKNVRIEISLNNFELFHVPIKNLNNIFKYIYNLFMLN